MERDAVNELMANRRAANGTDRSLIGTERVDIALEGDGNGPFVVRKRDWEWVVDEPPERGGTDSGPNPLAYFLSGSISCLLSHYMLCAIEADVEVSNLKVTARMRYDRSAEISKVTEVIYKVTMSSDASRDEVSGMLERAQDMCYAHNTLAAAGVKLITDVELNGSALIKLECG